MSTAVNFHLVLFLLFSFIWPPSTASWFGAALWLWFWGWLCHPGSLLLTPAPSCDTCPLTFMFCTHPLVWCLPPPPRSPARVALALGWWSLLSPDVLFKTTRLLLLPNHWHLHDDPPLYLQTPTLARSLHSLPRIRLSSQSASCESVKGSSCSQ